MHYTQRAFTTAKFIVPLIDFNYTPEILYTPNIQRYTSFTCSQKGIVIPHDATS